MATVQVSSWAEFLEAVAVSGDTVECPENAVWDMAELEPDGHVGYITCNAKINGNGTEIRNIVMRDSPSYSRFFFNDDVDNLHILNGVFETSGYICGVANFKTMQRCTISGQARGTPAGIIGINCYVYRCALNVEFATATGAVLFARNVNAQYINAKLSGSAINNVTLYSYASSDQLGAVENSYIILDTPRATNIYGRKFKTSVLRCNAANITSLPNLNDVGGSSAFSLIVSSDFPNLETIPSGLKAVSENNLRDAGYLQSIGFPIGA
jgi:hypothetical protein